MLNKLRKTLAILSIFTSINTAAFPLVSRAAEYNFCPQSPGLHGWWGTISPTNHYCPTVYYTWNTISGLGGEESWYDSSPHYLLCDYSSLLNPGNISAEVYIPSPDYSQTPEGAHYYKGAFGSYTAIGTVPQYYIFGTAVLSTVDWSQFDTFKLSDWTYDSTIYSKHIDLDTFRLECYFS